MCYTNWKTVYEKISPPEMNDSLTPVDLTITTWCNRLQKVLQAMRRYNVDAIAVYGDREHGANFAYLTGFEPRFEEAVLVLHKDGSAKLMLGNENMKMCTHSMLPAEAVHVPYFSLPNQPMGNDRNMEGLFRQAGIKMGMKVGIAGWKMFTDRLENNRRLFDVPEFIMKGIRKAAGDNNLINISDLFIHPKYGVRSRMNANEIAHYEFGAALASRCVFRAMEYLEPGRTEMEIAGVMCNFGQPVSVTTICATGRRFDGGVVFPRNKKIKMGEKFSLTMGLRGGLSSRAAYVAGRDDDMEESVRDYMDILAKPYYKAAAVWYSLVGIGISGGELYQRIEEVLPKEKYFWTLNPGHLTADEEWLSSPVYSGSNIHLQSGMVLQMDIIPGLKGYGGAGAEDGIAIADNTLRKELCQEYPAVWKRFERRKRYMKDKLGIALKPEVLPMSDIAGYMRPYLLNRQYAFKIVDMEEK